MSVPRRKIWLKRALKLVLGLLVLAMVGRHVLQVWRELSTKKSHFHFEPAWVAGCIALYCLGLLAFGTYFWRILRSSATPVAWGPAQRAYVISHLGKYVPGKALVVVLRAGLVAPHGARPATAAFATFYETLVMMASGGLLAAALFATLGEGHEVWIPWPGRGPVPLPLAALGLALGGPLAVLALPRVFPLLATLFRTPFPGVGPEALPRFHPALLAEGLAWSSLGWTLWGLSQVALARGLGIGGGPTLQPHLWPLVVASVALATLAGFVVAVFPGGLVVREGVLMAALGPVLGPEEAVIAALALRLAWVAAELLASGVALLHRPWAPHLASPVHGESDSEEPGT